MTALWRNNVITPSKNEKLSFCVYNIGKNWFSRKKKIVKKKKKKKKKKTNHDFHGFFLAKYGKKRRFCFANKVWSAYQFKYFQNNPILKSLDCTNPQPPNFESLP